MATIGLNAQLLNLSASYRGAGIHRYIHQTLLHLPGAAPQHRYVVFANDARMQSPRAALSLRRTRLPAHKPWARILWEQTLLPLGAFRERLDLLHAMAFARPLVAPCPVVLTIYDLSFARMPERFPPLQRLYLRTITRHSARRAERVIVISQSTKDDVVSFCGVPAGRIAVVYCGADEQFRPVAPAEVEAFRARVGLPPRFILYLGTLEPRKNVANLVRAYARLPRDGATPPLVIAGGKGWGFGEVFAAVADLGLEGRVLFPGYVPHADLALWYNAAEVFVYPSLFEGFGLPVLEAMACGTPVVTSNVSSLPEVAGDAALTVPPTDPDALAAAIRRVLDDDALRADLRARGLARARLFDWHSAAAQTARVYDEALARRAPRIS